jgi:hypothetical protein
MQLKIFGKDVAQIDWDSALGEVRSMPIVLVLCIWTCCIRHFFPLHLPSSVASSPPQPECKTIMKPQQKNRGITVTFGRIPAYERRKIGGAMIYADGCLIRGFERQQIGITSSADSWGVVAIIHLPTDSKEHKYGLKPQQVSAP